MSEEGYLQWAVQRLIDNARASRRSSGEPPSGLRHALEMAENMGTVEDFRGALAAAGGSSARPDQQQDVEES